MNFTRDQDYWVEHEDHGTLKANLRLMSTDEAKQLSLLFRLPQLIAMREPDGAMAITEWLGLTYDKAKGTFTELHTGQAWTVYEHEPAVKKPTK